MSAFEDSLKNPVSHFILLISNYFVEEKSFLVIVQITVGYLTLFGLARNGGLKFLINTLNHG